MNIFRLPAWFTIFLAIPQLLIAQQVQPTVTAKLDERQIGVGQSTVFQIIIVGGSPTSIPTTIQAEGLTITRFGEPRFLQTRIDGVPTNQIIVTYGIDADKAGDYRIPAVEFEIQGGTYSSKEMQLRVIEVGGTEKVTANDAYFMTFTADKNEVYVNEVVKVMCKVYARGANSLRSPGKPQIDNAERFSIRPFPHTYQLKLMQIEGLPYSSAAFPTTIFAFSDGEFEVGPARITSMIISQTPNGIGVSERFPTRRTIISKPLSFKIKPLPIEDKPQNFLGAVGNFELAVETGDTKVRIGDPISVDIKISGSGNFDSVVAPEIEKSEGWNPYPANRIDSGDLLDIERTVVFNQVVIPLAEHNALPSVSFSFFNPATEKYVTLNSDPVPLEIAQDQSRPNQSAVATFIGVPEEELNDILYIHKGSATWTPITASALSRPSFWFLEVGPLLAFSGLVGFGAWKLIMNHLERRRSGDRLSFEQVKEKLGHDRVSRGLFYKLVLEYFYRWRAENEALLGQVSNE
ncbi:MAG: BatD family protein, partial [Verrucomicrobiota bacterium]